MRGEDAAESQICFLVNETHRERKQSQVMKNRIRRKNGQDRVEKEVRSKRQRVLDRKMQEESQPCACSSAIQTTDF